MNTHFAYAAELSEKNYQAIASEKPGFDLDEARAWVEEHQGGFFVRDEGSPFDCEYIAPIVFYEMYRFDGFNENVIFHKIVRV